MPAFRPPESAELASVDTVIAAVLERCEPGRPITTPTAEAYGLVVAQEARALTAVPPFDNSSMDGFAVRSSDLKSPPTVLRLRGTREAGDMKLDSVLPAGHCDAIMTGAPLPAGADAVVPFEVVEVTNEDVVKFSRSVTRGSCIRRRGGDVAVGTVAAAAGFILTAQAQAALVACGVREVLTFPRPRLAILSTGQELVEDGPNSIPDSNSVYLTSALSSAFSVTRLPAVGDDEKSIGNVLLAAAEDHDAVITTGGVGPGVRDLLPSVAAEIGKICRLSVAMKPGKPFALGAIDGSSRTIPLFCLPGNPLSAMVSLNVLVMPGLRRLAGLRNTASNFVTAICTTDLPAPDDGKVHFLPAIVTYVDGTAQAQALGINSSHQVVSAATANALMRVSPKSSTAAGDLVATLLL